MFTATVDLTGLQRSMGGLQEALIGSGQSGDSKQIVRDETRHLAMQISKMLGPNPRTSLEKKIERDVSRSLLVMQPNIDPAHQGTGDIRWISSGPNFLVGVQRNAQPPANVEAIQGIIREKKGRAAIEISRRGKQRVYLSNRASISKQQAQSAIRQIKQKVGRLKASWAQTASVLGEASIPQWVSRHFPTPKNRMNLSNLFNDNHPSAVFGSAAPGVNKFASLIQAAANVRAKIIAARTKLIISGYSKDIARGIRPTRKAHAS